MSTMMRLSSTTMGLMDVICSTSFLIHGIILALNEPILFLPVMGDDGTVHSGLEITCDRPKNLYT